DREVAFLVPDFVAQVGHLVPAGVPDGFLAVDRVVGAVGLGVESHVVEDEEFRFRAEDGAVGDASGPEIFFAALGDAAGVAVVGFLGAGLGDGSGEREGGFGHERIDEGALGVGHGEYVGGLDGFPAADARAVEAQAVAEGVFGQFGD